MYAEWLVYCTMTWEEAFYQAASAAAAAAAAASASAAATATASAAAAAALAPLSTPPSTSRSPRKLPSQCTEVSPHYSRYVRIGKFGQNILFHNMHKVDVFRVPFKSNEQ